MEGIRMKPGRSLALLFVIALSVRVLAIYWSGPSALKFGDAEDYLRTAQQLCETGTYPDRIGAPFFRAPGLPFFISAVTACHPRSVWLVKTALAAVDTLSVGLIFLLAAGFFHDRRVGFLAASLSAMYPFFVVQTTDVRGESLLMLLLLSASILYLRGNREGLPGYLLAAGAASALAALTRPIALVLIFFLSLCVLAAVRMDWPLRAKLCALYLLGAAVCIGPWTARNAFRYHELILVNDAGGYNFWRGTSPEMAAVENAPNPEAFRAASLRFETETSPALASQIDRLAKTPLSRSNAWRNLAMQSYRANPAAFFRHLLRNAWAYWRPWLNPLTYSGKVVLASGVVFCSLYLLAAFGWRQLWNADRPIAVCIGPGMVVFWLAHIPFQVVTRFRVPIADPFLIILSSATLISIYSKYRITRPHAGCEPVVNWSAHHRT